MEKFNTVLTLHIDKGTPFLLIEWVDGMALVFSCVPFLGITNDKLFGIITSQEIKIISPFLASIRIALESTACLVHLNGFTILVEEPSDFWLRVSSCVTKQLCLPLSSLKYGFIAYNNNFGCNQSCKEIIQIMNATEPISFTSLTSGTNLQMMCI